MELKLINLLFCGVSLGIANLGSLYDWVKQQTSQVEEICPEGLLTIALEQSTAQSSLKALL